MFLLSDRFFDLIKKENCKPDFYNFSASFEFWKINLFERCMRLFTYANLPKSMPRKELEQMLIIQGYATVTDKYDGKVRCFYSNLGGQTKIYFDEFKTSNIFSPIYANSLNIDTDCVLVENTSIKNSLLPMITHYATLLGHATMTMQNVLVNARDANGTPIANTNQQKESIKEYYSNLWNGKKTSILDSTFTGVDFAGQHGTQGLSLLDIMEVSNNLLDNFYNDIGVKTSKDKKGNMLTPEIESDNPMLLLNIRDMLDARKIGIEKVNNKYGTNISVDIAEEIKNIGGYKNGKN